MAALAALLVLSSGCSPIVDNGRDSKPTDPGPAGEAVQGAAPDQATPSSGAGEDSLPFIAETRSPVPVVNVAHPGLLEVVDGCLTVTIRGKERATAVFPPGVKPELQGSSLVAVSFENRRIPLGQESPIPGGPIELSSAELVKPIPMNCPKTLFGLGG
jgi:hypothetical protein